MSTNKQEAPAASVIIPTFRDWPGVAQCLAALARQTLPAQRFEIIVVDNDALHAPPPLPAGVRCLHQPTGFSYAARNAGAAVAQGRVLAFTDADCLPAPGWLQAGLAALDTHPQYALVSGRIEVFSPKPNVVFRYETLFEFQQQQWAEQRHFGATANLFVRRSAFDQLGGFDAGMKSGGDADFGHRAGTLGLRLGYEAQALVLHPSRNTIGEVLQKNRRIATGFYGHMLRDARGNRRRIWRDVGYWLRPRPREWLHILSGRRGSHRFALHQRFGVLGLHMLLHYHTGFCLLRSHLSRQRSDQGVR
jgi:GT2 family glycosyltransferase